MRAARANLIPIDAGTMAQMDDAAAAVNARTGGKLAALSTLAVS